MNCLLLLNYITRKESLQEHVCMVFWFEKIEKRVTSRIR